MLTTIGHPTAAVITPPYPLSATLLVKVFLTDRTMAVKTKIMNKEFWVKHSRRAVLIFLAVKFVMGMQNVRIYCVGGVIIPRS